MENAPKPKKPVWKRWWFILSVTALVVAFITSGGEDSVPQAVAPPTNAPAVTAPVPPPLSPASSPPTTTTPPTSSDDAAKVLLASLTEYLANNFVGVSWYPLIESVRVGANTNKRTFSVVAETQIFPDGDAPRPARSISMALQGWALKVEREGPLRLDWLAVYGMRAGGLVELRSWSSISGWRDR